MTDEKAQAIETLRELVRLEDAGAPLTRVTQWADAWDAARAALASLAPTSECPTCGRSDESTSLIRCLDPFHAPTSESARGDAHFWVELDGGEVGFTPLNDAAEAMGNPIGRTVFALNPPAPSESSPQQRGEVYFDHDEQRIRETAPNPQQTGGDDA